MKTQTLTVPENAIDTDAQDHAEETQYAVTHRGRELHPEPKAKREKSSVRPESDVPWQMD